MGGIEVTEYIARGPAHIPDAPADPSIEMVSCLVGTSIREVLVGSH